MQKQMSVGKIATSSKAYVGTQTEELIADTRCVITPSQRVEEKLAACSGSAFTLARRSDERHAPRRPR